MSVRRLLALAGIASAMTLAPVTGAFAASTTVALWHMDDTGTTMRDASAYANHGTLSKVAVGQAGWLNKAFAFSGTPSFVRVPSRSSLNPGTAPFAVTVHVRFSVRPSSSVGDYDLVRKGYSTTTGGHWKVEILQSGVAFCELRGSGAYAGIKGSVNLADGRWHTIQCKRTSTTVTLVVDGVSKSVTKSTGTISNTADVFVGAKKSTGGDQYAGLLDEVTITRG
jgi:hypothetical protein